MKQPSTVFWKSSILKNLALKREDYPIRAEFVFFYSLVRFIIYFIEVNIEKKPVIRKICNFNRYFCAINKTRI